MPRPRDSFLVPDRMDDRAGGYYQVESDGWPEGMDRHAGSPAYQARAKEQWRKLLDKGSIGQSFDLTTGTPWNSKINQGVGLEAINCRSDNDRNPIPVNVQLFTLPGSAYSPQNDFFAKVEWGVEGFLGSADVDLSQGLMLNLYCTSLKVLLFADPLVTVDGGRIGASASYGVRAAHAPPTRTLRQQAPVAPAATGENVVIPLFARGVWPLPNVQGAGNYAADYVVRQKDSAGTVLSEHPYIFTAPTGYLSAARIPLLNDARQVDIENVDAAKSLSVNWVFDLAL